jgi:hypothetical protein
MLGCVGRLIQRGYAADTTMLRFYYGCQALTALIRVLQSVEHLVIILLGHITFEVRKTIIIHYYYLVVSPV